jgi:FOG: Ankyrin repeat
MPSTTRRRAFLPLLLLLLLATLAGIAPLPRAARAQYPPALPQTLSDAERERLTKAYRAAPPGEAGRSVRHKLLRSAVQRRDFALFDLLTGAKAGAPGQDPDAGKTALMYAAEANDFEALRCLLPLKKTDRGDYAFECLYPGASGYIDRCDQDGYTALMYAASAGSVEAANYLINAGAALETQCYVARFTPLQLAQMGDKPEHARIAEVIEKQIAARAGKKNLMQLLFFNENVFASIGYTLMTGFLLGIGWFLGYHLLPLVRRIDAWAKAVREAPLASNAKDGGA